ncbi:hypothetical protein Prum_068190 [Phytohabitans rumicis]|uniref:Uncharacterized protein n=1 Tax=Phytohabitans rumicis TaxID=1076125 RepID=A0A6V8LGH1_9ACTN|nr:hypothetical protein Prum_068190 [Phytohabitans rumicis]
MGRPQYDREGCDHDGHGDGGYPTDQETLSACPSVSASLRLLVRRFLQDPLQDPFLGLLVGDLPSSGGRSERAPPFV